MAVSSRRSRPAGPYSPLSSPPLVCSCHDYPPGGAVAPSRAGADALTLPGTRLPASSLPKARIQFSYKTQSLHIWRLLGLGCGSVAGLEARRREARVQIPSLPVAACGGGACLSLRLSFLAWKMGLKIASTPGVLTKVKFNAVLDSNIYQGSAGT